MAWVCSTVHMSPIVSALGLAQNVCHERMTPGPLATCLRSTLHCGGGGGKHAFTSYNTTVAFANKRSQAKVFPVYLSLAAGYSYLECNNYLYTIHLVR